MLLFGSLKMTPCLRPWASLSSIRALLSFTRYRFRFPALSSGAQSHSWPKGGAAGSHPWLLARPSHHQLFDLLPHKSYLLTLESSRFLTPGKQMSPAQTFVWNGLENCITVSDFNLCSVCWRLHAARNTQTKHYSCLQMIPIIFSPNKYCTWHSGILRDENKFM